MSKMICQTCSASLPDNARFCGACGTIIPSVHDQPDIPTSQFPLLSDATVLMLREIEDSLVKRKEPDDITLAYPIVRLQKDDEENKVFLPQPMQPIQLTELSPPRAEHKQPGMQRAEHQQPQIQHAIHQQPLVVRTEHFQPGVAIRKEHRQYKSGKDALSVKRMLLGAGAIVVVVVIAVLTFSNLPVPPSNAAPGPQIALVNATAFPGSSVALHGSNFTPGASISFRIDGYALAQNAHQATADVYPQMSVAFFSKQLLQQNAGTIVQADGTFDATLLIPRDLKVNTTHDIQAVEQDNGKKAQAKVTVVDHAVAPTPTLYPTPTSKPVATPALKPTPDPTPGPTPIPTPQPSPTPALLCLNVDNNALTFNATTGANNPASQSFTINNGNGCGAGKWSAAPDSPWLTLDQSSGTIAANGSVHVQVSASLASLKAGTYTGHIQISPGSKLVTVTLTIQASVCIQSDQENLSFTGDVGIYKKNPASQAITITNCGRAGTVTATAVTNNGVSWLAVSRGGMMDAGGDILLNVQPACLNQDGRPFLNPGLHSGTVIITITASDGTQATRKVTVSFDVTQSHLQAPH